MEEEGRPSTWWHDFTGPACCISVCKEHGAPLANLGILWEIQARGIWVFGCQSSPDLERSSARGTPSPSIGTSIQVSSGSRTKGEAGFILISTDPRYSIYTSSVGVIHESHVLEPQLTIV